jgi:phosphoadenosine phosphosulfate reductase
VGELLQLEKKAIQRLQSFEPDDGYYLCYSGGKDSDVIKILAHLAGVKFEAVNNHTTVDAPETVYYIRSQPDVRVDYPEKTMWQLIEQKLMPPTRLMRYCCSELKERGGKGKVKITGVRWAESNNRKENGGLVKIIGKPKTMQRYAEENDVDYAVTKQNGLILNYDDDKSRRMVEHCYRTTSTMVNPIIEWEDTDVWQFLCHYGCKSNPLYECGFKRVGCIGCPMASTTRKVEFARYPKYKENYIRAFDRMLIAREKAGKPTQWKSGEEVFYWWIREDPNQVMFTDILSEV